MLALEILSTYNTSVLAEFVKIPRGLVRAFTARHGIKKYRSTAKTGPSKRSRVEIMRKVVTLLFIVLVPGLLAAQTRQKVRKNRLLVFKNVTLIDMRTENPKANMTVVVSGNRIADIGAKVKTPKDAQVINASGKYLIPGLWDMHVHVLEPERPPLYRLYLANGITRVRDMGSSMSLLESRALRRRIETGGILGP